MEQGGNMKLAIISRDSSTIYYISFEYNFLMTLIPIYYVSISITVAYSRRIDQLICLEISINNNLSTLLHNKKNYLHYGKQLQD